MIKQVSPKIRVLRILNRPNVGGPSYNVAYLSKYLSDQYETKIVTGVIEEGEASSNYIFDALGLNMEVIPHMKRQISFINDIKSLLSMIKIINVFKPEIIHTHAAKAGAIGRFATLFSKHKPKFIFHTYHGNVFDGYFSPLKTKIILYIERYLAKLSTKIIAISDKQSIELIEKYNIAKASKTAIIPLGFDLEKFSKINLEAREHMRLQMGLSASDNVIVITGRLTEIKNHSFFLKVLAHCKFDLQLSFKAIIVGDGMLKSKLLEQANQLQLKYTTGDQFKNDTVLLFTSWRKDINLINAAADIAVLTSLNEGTPVSIIEAMASGKAVISSNVGGVEDLIKHKVSGFVSELDVETFSQYLAILLKDNQLCQTYGKTAQDAVLTKYHFKRLVSDIEQLYSNSYKKIV